jgi:molecular chaperone DnaJ
VGTENAYAELGLRPGANEAEVKAAWRRLVSLWHPDRNASRNAVDKMQRINEAFEVLSRAGFAQEAAAAPPTPAAAEAAEAAEAAPASASGRPPRTIHRKLVLSLAEAALGCTRELRGRIGGERCTGCSGTGWRVLRGRCPGCAGNGLVRRPSLMPWFAAVEECAACHGAGIARRICTECSGKGRSPSRAYRVTLRIPPGVCDGDRLQAQVPGTASGRPALAVELRIGVAPHDLLQLLDDGQLHCEVPVDGFAWVAQHAVEVPTLEGTQRLRLRCGQLSYRLPGQGFPRQRRGPRGDLSVTIVPVFPETLGAEREALLEQLVAHGVGPDGWPRDAGLRAWQRRLRAARGRGATATP